MSQIDSRGYYTAPGQVFELAVPPAWKLSESPETTDVESPTGRTAVTVSTFRRQDDDGVNDARWHLRHFLETAPYESPPRVAADFANRASAQYEDGDGRRWSVLFLAKGQMLLLATVNSVLLDDEWRTAQEVLASIQILRIE